jgi:hypothetical protein
MAGSLLGGTGMTPEEALAEVRQRLREVVKVLAGKDGYEGIDPVEALVFLTEHLANDGMLGRALVPRVVARGWATQYSDNHWTFKAGGKPASPYTRRVCIVELHE